VKFGLSLPHFRQAASPEAIRRVAHRAEHLGYDGVWVSDHIVIPHSAVDRFGTIFYEPLAVLGFAAACTSKIRLGTTVLILPYRNPLVTAKVLSTLDVLSGGRVTAGMAVGWTEDEFKALGVPFQERGALSDEYIAAFKVLWTQDKPTFHGQFVRFENIAFEPKPVQKPYPPVLLGAHGPKALQRVARSYDGWFPLAQSPEALKRDVETLRKLVQEAGRNPDAIQVTALVEPRDGGPSVEELKRYRDAGASRVIVFSQQMGTEAADGKALALVKQLAPVVERAQKV